MSSETDLESFARLVESISPWLDQVVIIGGWAHRLHRLHPTARPLDYPPLATLDTDVAVPTKLELKDQNIRERLLANGFREEFLSDHRPPVTHYLLRDSDSAFYAEFLTPLVGSEYGRDGKRKATLTVSGVQSQKLRHLGILLNTPWQLVVDSSSGFPLLEARRLQVPNPTSFLAQKILIHSKRSQEDRAKDILYMHDTLEIFSEKLGQLSEIWQKVLRPTLNAKSIRAVERAPFDLFGQKDDLLREASRMAIGRALSAQAIQESCALGLSQLFR